MPLNGQAATGEVWDPHHWRSFIIFWIQHFVSLSWSVQNWICRRYNIPYSTLSVSFVCVCACLIQKNIMNYRCIGKRESVSYMKYINAIIWSGLWWNGPLFTSNQQQRHDSFRTHLQWLHQNEIYNVLSDIERDISFFFSCCYQK